MILLAPVVFFKTLRATVLLPVVQILGVSLIITNLITSMSQIFLCDRVTKMACHVLVVCDVNSNPDYTTYFVIFFI